MNRRRWLAIAAAALAVVLGGGAALAATGSRNPASDFVGDVAKRLGISQDRLEDAIQEATIARIDAAVAAGDITKAQGDALKQRVRSGEMPPILPTVRGPGFSHGLDKGIVPGFLPGSDLMAAAAGYIGMDEAEVREALRDGKSLADLAEEQGKSVDGLKTALRDEIREDADRAVGDGVLTKEQADRLVEKLSVAVDELVDKPGGPEFDRHGPGFGPAPPGPLEKAIVPRFLPGDLVETAADSLGMDGPISARRCATASRSPTSPGTRASRSTGSSGRSAARSARTPNRPSRTA
jgi:hypothetical protein